MRRRGFLAGSAAFGMVAAAAPLAATAAPAPLRFHRGFVWGVSTSAFQIEGALNVDGRGPSVWDDLARGGDPARRDPGIDHYFRWREDVALLKRLGIDAYRFSVAWPRVLPEGTGAVNPPGLDFYDRLVDALLAGGIEPVLCLYHWDLPSALAARGGWLDRATVDAFARYALVVAGRLGDRVKRWIPVNEALSIAYGGYALGLYPPFVADTAAYLAAAHHLNLAQGAAMKALARPGREIGTALSLYPIRAASAAPEDREAAKRREATTTKLFFDPLALGRYPAPIADRMAAFMRDGDMAIIRHDAQFHGVNYYGPRYCRAAPQAAFGVEDVIPPGERVSLAGIPIDAGGLYDQLLELRDAYGNPPVFVTENGAAFPDAAAKGARIDDRDRIGFLRDHLAAAHRALGEGAQLRGYFVWSIFDNYEWLVGFGNRYGLVYVDERDRSRVPKASFDWYREVIATGRVPPSA